MTDDRREEMLPVLARLERLQGWKTDAMAVLGEWDRLANEVMERLTRCEALAIDVAWRAAWMTRVVNLLGALRDDLGHELTESGHLAELEQLLADEFEDGFNDE